MYLGNDTARPSIECDQACSYACCRPLTSILSILSMACTTVCDFCGSGSFISLPKTLGMICHDKPNLSLSQPQRLFSPPAESFSHSSSTSSCVSQLTKNEIASVNLNFGPAFRPINS